MLQLGSIRTIIDLDKHCVLDVVPSAIDKLNYAQYYPIVVNLKCDRKDVIKGECHVCCPSVQTHSQFAHENICSALVRAGVWFEL